MATPESINRLLSVAASLVDQAASEIRDAKLHPVRENIEHVGTALAEIFEIQRAIYQLQPNLTPDHLKQPSDSSAANHLLTEFMCNALEFERAGDITRAMETLQEFLALESSSLHRNIAASEIQRLQRAAGT